MHYLIGLSTRPGASDTDIQVGNIIAYSAMDPATIKGLVEHLKLKALTKAGADSSDNRRRVVELTMDGRLLANGSIVKPARMAELTHAVQAGAFPENFRLNLWD